MSIPPTYMTLQAKEDMQREELLEFVRLYLKTYADTQTHPTPAQEAACINAARELLA